MPPDESTKNPRLVMIDAIEAIKRLQTDDQRQAARERGDRVRRAGDQMMSALEAAAKAHDIPWQRQAQARGTGNNAYTIQMTRAHAAAALVAVPLRYMHSPVEVLSLGDVDLAAELIARTLISMPADVTFPAFPEQK